MDALHRLLVRGLASKDVEGALEEFAWRSLMKGVRVREWCNELRVVLDQVSGVLPRRSIGVVLDRHERRIYRSRRGSRPSPQGETQRIDVDEVDPDLVV